MNQTPIGSGFGPTTTAQEVLGDRRLDGQTAIVTGGYSGLGLETARVLAGAGAHVIVPARRPEIARAAVPDGVELATLDLADPASIDAFTDRFHASGRPLDLLINAAGIMAVPEGRDAAGHELQLAVNHLGHFRLTTALLDVLRGRVISVSSLGHQIAGVDFDDPDFTRRPYDKWVAYGQSKSANALFAVGLAARGVHAHSLHPGTIWTGLARHLTDEDLRNLGVLDPDGNRITEGLKTVPQGAATIVFAALDDRPEPGTYLEDCDVAQLVQADGHVPSGVRPWAVDLELAERLWTFSERALN
ncbi:SDR family NAD(P)-dependent oxidoreductase [Solirubrobacter phytolaccae]|uniref:SDR family NAD(P)-dependent oxidoreductase n=1 Tax=Solirubrobacter phytolaccae TaxID=1404360 RepID=A0A9X3SEV0_9ACTN|nr:SDR family NAD(P)-dependent oxidoreductase [Solirubrobacter phytolaccae]MDA0185330.1 SDR family NAD(P)-dependent oxidoreductase [Solirubrobacter phytolaccae]